MARVCRPVSSPPGAAVGGPHRSRRSDLLQLPWCVSLKRVRVRPHPGQAARLSTRVCPPPLTAPKRPANCCTGWAFAGDGSCVSVPQLDPEKKLVPSRSCVAAYPTRVAEGLLWVWADSGAAAEAESAAPGAWRGLAPEIDEHGDDAYSPMMRGHKWYVRDLPVAWLAAKENAYNDCSHDTVLHSGVVPGLHRSNAQPMQMRVEEMTSTGYVVRCGLAWLPLHAQSFMCMCAMIFVKCLILIRLRKSSHPSATSSTSIDSCCCHASPLPLRASSRREQRGILTDTSSFPCGARRDSAGHVGVVYVIPTGVGTCRQMHTYFDVKFSRQSPAAAAAPSATQMPEHQLMQPRHQREQQPAAAPSTLAKAWQLLQRRFFMLWLKLQAAMTPGWMHHHLSHTVVDADIAMQSRVDANRCVITATKSQRHAQCVLLVLLLLLLHHCCCCCCLCPHATACVRPYCLTHAGPLMSECICQQQLMQGQLLLCSGFVSTAAMAPPCVSWATPSLAFQLVLHHHHSVTVLHCWTASTATQCTAECAAPHTRG